MPDVIAAGHVGSQGWQSWQALLVQHWFVVLEDFRRRHL